MGLLVLRMDMRCHLYLFCVLQPIQQNHNLATIYQLVVTAYATFDSCHMPLLFVLVFQIFSLLFLNLFDQALRAHVHVILLSAKALHLLHRGLLAAWIRTG